MASPFLGFTARLCRAHSLNNGLLPPGAGTWGRRGKGRGRVRGSRREGEGVWGGGGGHSLNSGLLPPGAGTWRGEGEDDGGGIFGG